MEDHPALPEEGLCMLAGLQNSFQLDKKVAQLQAPYSPNSDCTEIRLRRLKFPTVRIRTVGGIWDIVDGIRAPPLAWGRWEGRRKRL